MRAKQGRHQHGRHREEKEEIKTEIRNIGREVLQKTRRESVKRDEK